MQGGYKKGRKVKGKAETKGKKGGELKGGYKYEKGKGGRGA